MTLVAKSGVPMDWMAGLTAFSKSCLDKRHEGCSEAGCHQRDVASEFDGGQELLEMRPEADCGGWSRGCAHLATPGSGKAACFVCTSFTAACACAWVAAPEW